MKELIQSHWNIILKYLRESGISISCTKKDDFKTISDEILNKLSKKYKIQVPEKKNP